MEKSDIVSILKWIALGAAFVVPFVVLLVADSAFFPFVAGKAAAFRLLTVIGGSAWLMLAILEPKYRPHRSWFIAVLTTLLLWMGVTTLLGADPYRSFWSSFERMEGYYTLVLIVLYGYMLMSLLRTRRQWMQYLVTTAGAGVLVALYALMEASGATSGSASRIDATLGNPTYLGVYMLISIFIVGIIVRAYWHNIWVRYGGIAVLVLELYVLIQTGTRGSMLGLVGGLFVAALAFAIFERTQRRARGIAIGLLITIVVAIGGFIAFRDSALVQSVNIFRRLADISLEDATTQSRIFIWTNVATEGIAERPILGWGLENFNIVFNKHYDPKLYKQEPWFDRSHNVIMDWAVTGGVPGVILYCALFGALLFILWRPSNTNMSITERAIITGALAGYTIHNLFVFDSITSYILFITLASYVHVRTTEDASDDDRVFSGWQASSALQYAALVIIPVVCVYSLYAHVWRPWHGAQLTVTALRMSSGMVPMGTTNPFAVYMNAIDVAPFGAPEVAAQMYEFTKAVQAQGTIDQATLEQLHEENKAITLAEIERAPDAAARTWYLYGVYLNAIGKYAEAEEAVRNALEQSPQKQMMMFTLINAQISQGKLDEALEQSRIVFELDESFNAARDAYALMLVQTGDSEAARTLIEHPGFVPSDQLINATVQAENFELAEVLWRLRTEANPMNVQSWVSYAAVLYKQGKTEAAIATLEEALETLPEEAAQLEAFIEQIRQGSITL